MLGSLQIYYASLTAETRQKLFLVFSVALFYLLVSIPILEAGYYSDDAFESLVRGELLVTHRTLWNFVLNADLSWFMQGRLFPLLFFISNPFQYIFHTPITYQTARVLCIFASLLPFAWLLKLLTGKREPAFALLFLIPLFWSVRYFFDPLTSFAVQMPQPTLFAGLALCFYVKAEDTGRRHWHAWGLLAYLTALMTYEPALIVYPAILALAWAKRRSIRALLPATWPYLTLTIAYLAAAFVIRKYSAGMYDGIKVGEITRILPTFAMQLSGTLPLSHALFGNMHFGLRAETDYKGLILREIVTTIVLCAVSAISFYRLLPKIKFTEKATVALSGVGLSLILIPAALISFSAKYQGVPPLELFGLHWGVSYQPVYMQYIGLAMLCLLGITWGLGRVAPRNKPLISGLLAILLSLVIGISVLLNNQVVLQENDAWQNGRDLVADALRLGLMPKTPEFENDFTIVSKRGLWNVPKFYMQTIGIAPKVLDTTTDPESVLPKNDKPSGIVTFIDHPAFMLDYDTFENSTGDYSGGYVVLGRIKAMRYATVNGKRKVTGFTLEKTRVFIAEKPGASVFKILENLQGSLALERDRSTLLEILARNMNTRGKDWILVEFPAGAEQDWSQ